MAFFNSMQRYKSSWEAGWLLLLFGVAACVRMPWMAAQVGIHNLPVCAAELRGRCHRALQRNTRATHALR